MTDKDKLEKLKKLADAMYYAANYLTTDASRLHKAMEEYHQFIIHEYFKEEPVSEDLEKASTKYAQDKYMPVQTSQAFKAGANWQKEKEYTCYEEAFEDGAKWKKEQMMANAIDVTVHIDAGGYPYIPQMELYDYDKDIPLAKKGNKYKVVLIKE